MCVYVNIYIRIYLDMYIYLHMYIFINIARCSAWLAREVHHPWLVTVLSYISL